MNRTLIAAALVAGLGACKYDKSGVYIAYFPDSEDAICEITYSENITDSDPPTSTTTYVSDWVFVDESTTSDEVRFVQIFKDRGGNVIVQIGNDVYVGTESSGVITAEWTNQVDSLHSEDNAEADYHYEETEQSLVKNTITLTPNKDSKGYSGNWKSTLQSTVRAEESDEWDAYVGPYSGQINTMIFQYLYGSGSNVGVQQDCDSPNCFVEVVSSCSGSSNFELVETELDPEAYKGVENAGQPAGL